MNNIKKIQDEINQVMRFQPQEIYSKDEIITGSALVQFNTLCDNLIQAQEDLEQIRKVYKEYYDKTKGTSSFLTCDPDSKISKATFKITVELADKFDISPLSLLLPNTKIHSFSDALDNIEVKENWDEYVSSKDKNSLQTLIAFYQQHFYGADNLVDIHHIINFPIKDLQQVHEYEETGELKKITINSDFFERILNLNSLIREAYNLEKEIQEVEESGYSLKAELIKLANALFDNGTNGRFGSEGYAGPGASIAIGEFRGKWNAYYKDEFVKLADKLEQNSNTCKEMKKLITEIHQLDDGSCVDIKSKALKAATKELESVLDKNFTEEKDSNKHKETLTNLNNRYKTITAEIVKLKNEGKIKTIDSLPLDITCFLQKNKLSMKSVYNNAESINIFDLETILQQVSGISVDEMNEEDIFNNILLYPKHFLAIWNRLSEESKQEIQNHIKEDKYIYKAIANQINDPHTTDDLKERLLNITINVLTKDGENLYKIYSNLDDYNQKNYLNKLHFMISTGDHFKKIYELLDTFLLKSERNSYFEAAKDKLPSITNTGDDFKKIYELLDTFVSKSERNNYFEAVKDKLSSITNTGDDFKKIYELLNTFVSKSERNSYCEAVKSKLTSIINTKNEFENIYKIFNNIYFKTNAKEYIDFIQSKLPSLIQTKADFKWFYQKLDIKDKNNYVDVIIKDTLPSIINTAFEFYCVYEMLDAGDKNNYVDAIKDKLPSLTNAIHDFSLLYKTLDVQDRRNYVNAIKDKLTSLAHTKDEFYAIYSTLEAEYRKEYLQNLTALKDNHWFGNILNDINLLDKKTALLEALCKRSSQNVRKIFGYGGTNITFNGQIYNVTNEVAETLTQKFLSLVSNKDISYEEFHGSLITRLKECARNQPILRTDFLRSQEDRLFYNAIETKDDFFSFCWRRKNHSIIESYLSVNGAL